MTGAVQRLWYGRSLWRWLLWPLSLLFRALAATRRALYRAGVLQVVPSPVPVIVVGNIGVGGAGKTPLTVWLARALVQRGLRVGVVSRGYGGRRHPRPHTVRAGDTAADVGDEPLLIARRTGVPVTVCADRPAAVAALAAQGIELVLSDDGLQHYRMQRTVEIAVIDGARGLGNGLCLPAGPLREAPARLGEVDAVVINGAGEVPASAAGRPVWRMTLVPGDAQSLSGGRARPLTSFAGNTVHAVAGIADPQRFFAMLEAEGIGVIAHPLADHARLRADDLLFDDACPVLMTEKDMVRCTHLELPDHWYVPVSARLDGDADPVDHLLALAGLRSAASARAD